MGDALAVNDLDDIMTVLDIWHDRSGGNLNARFEVDPMHGGWGRQFYGWDVCVRVYNKAIGDEWTKRPVCAVNVQGHRLDDTASLVYRELRAWETSGNPLDYVRRYSWRAEQLNEQLDDEDARHPWQPLPVTHGGAF